MLKNKLIDYIDNQLESNDEMLALAMNNKDELNEQYFKGKRAAYLLLLDWTYKQTNDVKLNITL